MWKVRAWRRELNKTCICALARRKKKIQGNLRRGEERSDFSSRGCSDMTVCTRWSCPVWKIFSPLFFPILSQPQGKAAAPSLSLPVPFGQEPQLAGSFCASISVGLLSSPGLVAFVQKEHIARKKNKIIKYNSPSPPSPCSGVSTHLPDIMQTLNTFNSVFSRQIGKARSL